MKLRTDKSFLRRIASLSVAFCWVFSSPAPAADNTRLTSQMPADFAPKLPDVTFSDLRGAPLSLARLPAKLRILHYWATWCAPCVKELPHLDALQGEYERYGLKVAAISIDAREQLVESFYRQNAIANLPAYIDKTSRGPRMLDVTGVPTSIFVDDKGRELARATGPVDWTDPEIRRTVRSMLGLK